MSSPPTLPPFLATSPPLVTPLPSAERLQALYASTSIQRSTNLTGYQANAQWWAGVIEETLRSGWINGDLGDRLVVRVDEGLLGKVEDARGNRPRGIGGVVETLATTAPPTLHPSAHFFSSLTPLHAAPSLSSRFIGRPLWWAVSQLNPFGSSDKVEKEETLWGRYGKGKVYVHMPLLEKSAAAFTAHLSKNPILSYTDSLYDIESFRETYGHVCLPRSSTAGPQKQKQNQSTKADEKLSKRDVEVLIKWLSRDCGLVVTDGSVIKVLDTDQVAADHPITEADRGAVSVQNALRKIEKQMLGIDEQIEQSQQKAKKHLSLGQKNIALSYLRSKKQLEELLAKRVGSSEQLRAVIRNIDQAKGDVEILAAYETSTSTLASVLAHPSLSPEHIAQTTDSLAEAMANQEEIDEAVRVGGEIAMGNRRVEVDDDELAQELEELVQQEREQERARGSARQKEKEAAEQQATVERLEKEKQERLDTAPIVPAAPTTASKQRPAGSPRTSDAPAPAPASASASDEASEQALWQERYELAQERKAAEAQRADAERLAKEARRVAAE